MAYVTGVVLMVLCFVGVPLQLFAHDNAVASYVGTTHGILYIIYLVTPYLLPSRPPLPTAPRASPPAPSGHLLPRGGGEGPLARASAPRPPGWGVWAAAVNRPALGLGGRNAAGAGLRCARRVFPDDPALPGRFQLIWSNPPIRI